MKLVEFATGGSDNASTKNTQNTQKTQNTQDTQKTQKTQNTQNTQNTQDTQNTPNTQNTQNTQDTQMMNILVEINKKIGQLDIINQYYNNDCPTYKIDTKNNICTKMADRQYIIPREQSPNFITYVCPADAEMLPATTQSPPICAKCINGATMQQNGTCKKANK